MNCARTSMSRQWANIGSGAFKKGLALAAVLTGNQSIDNLITAGYEKAQKKAKRA